MSIAGDARFVARHYCSSLHWCGVFVIGGGAPADGDLKTARGDRREATCTLPKPPTLTTASGVFLSAMMPSVPACSSTVIAHSLPASYREANGRRRRSIKCRSSRALER